MIRSTLVLLVAQLIVPSLRQCSAAERHLLWAASLLTATVVPIFSLVLPTWQPEWTRRLTDDWSTSWPSVQWLAEGPDVVVRATGIESSAWTFADWVVLIWITGVAIALLRLVGEMVKLARLQAAADPVNDRRSLLLSVDVARELGLTSAPFLLQSSSAVMPITWGVGRPRVLLPDSARMWSDERLRVVLAHEFAHMRRSDWIVHLLAQFVCAVYWFHPLFWLAERQLRRESERAADDAVLQLGFEGSAYAAHVLAVVRAACRPAPYHAPAMAHEQGLDFEMRVSAMLSDEVRRNAVTRRTVGTTVAISVALTLLIAAVHARGETVDIEIRTLNVAPILAAPDGTGRDAVALAVPHVRVRGLPQSASGPTVGDYTTPPLYSEAARRNGVEGIVTIGARVDERGGQSQLRVVTGLGFGLDQNAIVALRQWRFRPGTVQGTPVAMDAEVDIEFSLKTEAINALIANDMATLVGPGVTPPRAIRTTGPRSRPLHTHGSVMLDVVVLEDGSPRVVRILRSLTPEADESALQHFEQWRFSPAMKNGQPVKVRLHAEVRFHG